MSHKTCIGNKAEYTLAFSPPLHDILNASIRAKALFAPYHFRLPQTMKSTKLQQKEHFYVKAINGNRQSDYQCMWEANWVCYIESLQGAEVGPNQSYVITKKWGQLDRITEAPREFRCRGTLSQKCKQGRDPSGDPVIKPSWHSDDKRSNNVSN